MSETMLFGDDEWDFEKTTERPADQTIEPEIDLVDAYTVLWGAHGKFIFATYDDLSKWLRLPHEAIGNRPPIDLIQSQEGLQQVKRLLGRLEYGIMA